MLINTLDNLEQILTEQGKLTSSQVERALKYAKNNSLSFEKSIIDLHFLTEKALLETKAEILGQRSVDLTTFPVASEAAMSVTENIARSYTLIPLMKGKGVITIAMADPMNMEAIEDVETHTHCRVETMLANERDIVEAIETSFGVYGRVEELLNQASRDRLEMSHSMSDDSKVENANIEGPIAQIVQLIITQAVNSNASDIHIEPLEKRLRVRFRIDGLLQEAFTFEKIYQAALTSSAKIMCAMDIAEKRIPQDGRFRIMINDRPIDLRASTFPAMHGEKFVYRILDKESANVELSQLGIEENSFEKINKVIHQPHGVFLVTGPTGSGKTTTLYSVLKEVNTPLVNVNTMEDPVEFDLDTVNQGQVNVKSGLTFAKGLRAMMRQDPDIIMIGEIRDGETAEIATQAALTGHLVLSTLHTNNAPGAVARLVDMGVEQFLVASSLAGVLAQRLVRRLCKKCKKPYSSTSEICERFMLDPSEGYTFYRAMGCRECGRTGYKGRAGIYEFMSATEEIRTLIVSGKSTSELREQAIKDGMKTLQMDGIQKAIQGITSIEEVLRVAGGT